MRDDASEDASAHAGSDTRAVYQQILRGDHRDGARGRIAFCTSSDDLSLSRGDLYVTLGLARALVDDGWGVSVWPLDRMVEPMPADIDVAIVMVESFVPGYVDERTKLVAWVRNWTDTWADLPFLSVYSQVWCSSGDSAARMREAFEGEVVVVPLATDPRLFHDTGAERSSSVVTTANFWGVPRQIEKALAHVAAKGLPVTWYGVNSRFLESVGDVDHRDAIDYFALPGVYSSYAVVVDDLIEQAAQYGNQNSRLFDALACGAAVVVNEGRGLDELGLADVPVYRDGDHLAEIVRDLVREDGGARARTSALRERVLAEHTWANRAEAVRPLLVALATDDSLAERPALLRWAADMRNELRHTRSSQDYYSTSYVDATRELQQVRAELDGERRVRAHWAHRLVDQIAAAGRRLTGRR